jgi:hypothetical protein
MSLEVPSVATAKAMVKPTFAIDAEGWVFILMSRIETGTLNLFTYNLKRYLPSL